MLPIAGVAVLTSVTGSLVTFAAGLAGGETAGGVVYVATVIAGTAGMICLVDRRAYFLPAALGAIAGSLAAGALLLEAVIIAFDGGSERLLMAMGVGAMIAPGPGATGGALLAGPRDTPVAVLPWVSPGRDGQPSAGLSLAVRI